MRLQKEMNDDLSIELVFFLVFVNIFFVSVLMGDDERRTLIDPRKRKKQQVDT